jgi:hypothetical protein
VGVAILQGIVLMRRAFEIATAAVPIHGNKVIDWIPVIGVVGSVATVFFGLLSLYWYLKSRRTKQLVFVFHNTRVQTRDHPEVTIHFRGEVIENLQRTEIVCWNGGTEEVRWTDIPDAFPPSLQFEDGVRVLSVAMVCASSPEISANVKETEKGTVVFTFDYLNPGEGVVGEILYEARDPSWLPAELNAAVKGGSVVVRPYHDGNFVRNEEAWQVRVGVSAILILGILCIALDAAFARLHVVNGWPTTLVAVLTFVFIILMSVRRIRYSRVDRVPEFASTALRGSKTKSGWNGVQLKEGKNLGVRSSFVERS